MSDRTKIIILLVLIGALAVIGGYQFLRKPGSGKSAKNKKNSVAAEETLPLLPRSADLEWVAGWLASDDASIAEGRLKGRFGLPMRAETPPLPQPQQLVGPVKPIHRELTAPPRVDGIVLRGQERVAWIEGNSYRAGQKVAGSEYTVGRIGISSVRFHGDQGNEITINLLQ